MLPKRPMGSLITFRLHIFLSCAFASLHRIDSTAFDPYYVSPYFPSPFTDENVYFIICPSHQVTCTHTHAHTHSHTHTHTHCIHYTCTHINFDTHFSLKNMVSALFQGNLVSILAHSVGQLSKIRTDVKS